MNKMLFVAFTIASSLYAQEVGAIKEDIAIVQNNNQAVGVPNALEALEVSQSSGIVVPQQTNNDFADSLANKIDQKLSNINRQIEEAQQIKNSSLNIPSSQLLDEKRVEQFLPIMTGGYSLSFKDSKKPFENKALAIDEKGQKYYLSLNNNDMVRGINKDYLVYKNSESNKNFKSPMALPSAGAEFKVSSTDTINSLTPVAQNIKQTPSATTVMEELKQIQQ